jgi:hypothetical protein
MLELALFVLLVDLAAARQCIGLLHTTRTYPSVRLDSSKIMIMMNSR